MSLPQIDPYVEAYFWLSGSWKHGLSEDWVRRNDVEMWLTQQIMNSLDGFGSEISRPYPWIAANIFDRLQQNGHFSVESNPVAGTYYSLGVEGIRSFRDQFVTNDEICRQAVMVGNRLFTDIFSVYSEGGLPFDSVQTIMDVPVPASDRVVTLQHNQIVEIAEPLTQLIEQVEGSNGDPDVPGFRERILGQLKAGHELLKSGVFRAYFLYSILLTALNELVSRHRGKAIAVAAEALLGLILQNIFSGS